jgi:hypothetical protein
MIDPGNTPFAVVSYVGVPVQNDTRQDDYGNDPFKVNPWQVLATRGLDPLLADVRLGKLGT